MLEMENNAQEERAAWSLYVKARMKLLRTKKSYGYNLASMQVGRCGGGGRRGWPWPKKQKAARDWSSSTQTSPWESRAPPSSRREHGLLPEGMHTTEGSEVGGLAAGQDREKATRPVPEGAHQADEA
jgi:hypothetical protein